MPKIKTFDERLKDAEDSIATKNYKRAIYQYEKCIENFPEQSKAEDIQGKIDLLNKNLDNIGVYITTENPNGICIKGVLIIPGTKYYIKRDYVEQYKKIKDAIIIWG